MTIVDISDYNIPQKLLKAKVREGLKGIIRNFLFNNDPQEHFQPYDKLNAFSTDQINKIAPKPDWTQAAKCVKAIVEGNNEENTKLLLINKPFSGTAEIVAKFLEKTDYTVLKSPSYDEIITYQGEIDLEFSKHKDIAIVDLENWFLRHYNGILYIKDLLEKMDAYDGSIILVCQSWVWSFLSDVLHLKLHNFEIKLFQALNHHVLQHWLLNLIGSGKRKLLYRLADNGNLVTNYQLDTAKELKEIMNNESKNKHKPLLKSDDKYMRHLVGYSLGLPLICWHIWRHSLRVNPDDKMDFENNEDSELNPYTIWVLPWEQISIPEVPQPLSSSEAIILHSIILHNGLPTEILGELLDFDDYTILSSIEKFTKLGLIYSYQRSVHVSANAYPKIRQYLDVNGFLIDKVEGI